MGGRARAVMPTHTHTHTNIQTHTLTYRGAVPNPFVSITNSYTHAHTLRGELNLVAHRASKKCQSKHMATRGLSGCMCVSGGQVPVKTPIPPRDPHHAHPPPPNHPSSSPDGARSLPHFHPCFILLCDRTQCFHGDRSFIL